MPRPDTLYLMLWREAIKNEHLKKGGKFKKIPKKNTCKYYKYLADYRSALIKSNVFPKPKYTNVIVSRR